MGPASAVGSHACDLDLRGPGDLGNGWTAEARMPDRSSLGKGQDPVEACRTWPAVIKLLEMIRSCWLDEREKSRKQSRKCEGEHSAASKEVENRSSPNSPNEGTTARQIVDKIQQPYEVLAYWTRTLKEPEERWMKKRVYELVAGTVRWGSKASEG
jgi:hypothetical protein